MKLDVKSHDCIMMGYCTKAKDCRLFHLVNQYIIIRRNVIFDEKNLGNNLLNSSFSLLNSDPFEIVEEIGSTKLFTRVLTR